MLLSVVTAVFNRRHVIGEAIRSLREQTFANYEHVIQDGGSVDGTLDVIRTLSHATTRLESGADGGIYAAINRGISRSHGDVVGLLHSDDELADRTVLERIARAMSDPAVDGVYGDLVYVAADDPNRIVRYWRAGAFERRKLRYGWMPPHPTLYLRADVFQRFGMYDEALRVSADYEAMVRWLYKDRIRIEYIPEVLVKMRVGGASNGSLHRMMRKSYEDLRVIRRHHLGGGLTLLCKNLQKANQFLARP